MSTQCVPEGGLGEKSCGICCIVDELDGGHRVADTKLYYGINIDSHTVFSEDLERKVIHPLYETCNITKKKTISVCYQSYKNLKDITNILESTPVGNRNMI